MKLIYVARNFKQYKNIFELEVSLKKILFFRLSAERINLRIAVNKGDITVQNHERFKKIIYFQLQKK